MISMKRAGLKLFSLCVLALGLVAFSATAAQAEGTWMVGGTDLTSGSKEVTGKLVGATGALLGTLGANAVNFKCTAASLVNAKLEKEGAISEASKNAKVKFSGCTTAINGTVAKACEPVNGAEKGVIVSESGYALFKEHSTGEGVTEIIPANEKNVFGVIHMGEACSIGEEVKVFGKLTVKDSGGEVGLETEKAIHTIEEFASLTELKIANGKSESKATLDGKAEAEVEGSAVWNALRPNRRMVKATGEATEEAGLIVLQENKNPFMLNAEIIARGPSEAKGEVLAWGTCTLGASFASLLSCGIIKQHAPAGSWVIWKAL